jgi:RsiW-degrading membrane proteinase PrsW (M82 family)
MPNFIAPLTEEITKIFWVYLTLFLWAEYKKNYEIKLTKLEIAALSSGLIFALWEAFTTYLGESIYHTLLRSVSHPLYVYSGYIAFRTQSELKNGLIAWILTATIAHSVFNTLSATTIIHQIVWVIILTVIVTAVRLSDYCRETCNFRLPFSEHKPDP